MDGVVIYVSKDRSRAIIWCSDQGPLGLVRRDAMPVAPHPPLAVGDFVMFDAVEDGELRLCGQLTPIPGRSVGGLPGMLRDSRPARPAPRLSVIAGAAAGYGEFTSAPCCG